MSKESFDTPPDFNLILGLHKRWIDAGLDHRNKEKLEQELTKPASIVRQVKSLFEQYALPDDSSNPRAFYTPQLPTEIFENVEGDQPLGDLFITHIDDKDNMYAIMNSKHQDSIFLTLPHLVFTDDGKNPTIYGERNKTLKDEISLIKTRILVDGLKYQYHDLASQQAREINIAKYINYDGSEFALDGSMVFYFSGANPYANYLPITIKNVDPGEAFEEAIIEFYEIYQEYPKPGIPSPLVVDGIEYLVRGEKRPIETRDLACFNSLKRALTTYDSDRDIKKNIYDENVIKPFLN